MKISAVVITYNEEANLKECLESLSFADEIIVMDTGSTDNTTEIAKKYTKHVFSGKRVTHVEPVRRLAISKATYDWILLLDADERLSEKLAKVLREHDESTPIVKIPRKNIIFNQWIQYSGWWPDYTIRFFRKDAVVWHDDIHSQPTLTGEAAELEAKEDLAITHFNYQSIGQYVTKMMTYTSIEANERNKKGEKVHWSAFMIEPTNEFMRRFFLLRGYLDGVHGLVLSMLQAFSVFLVIAKIWEHQGFTNENKHTFLSEFLKECESLRKQMSYWFLTSTIDMTKSSVRKIPLKIKRKYLSKK